MMVINLKVNSSTKMGRNNSAMGIILFVSGSRSNSDIGSNQTDS